ncbi:MAG: basic secretory protein-like protein [Gemmatimonadota bacterium]
MSKQLSGDRVLTAGLLWIVAVVVGLSAIPASVSAQYFGRNKVQYETFDFRVLKTDHYRIYYYPAEAEAVRDAARMAERWEHRYERLFNHKLTSVKPIVLYADHPDFQQTNTTPEALGEGTGGFTEGMKDRVVLPLTGSYRDTDHVIGHELVHSFQYDIAKERGALTRQGMGSLPLWLIEGMAEYLSLGREDTNTAMWLRDAALRGDLPTMRQLTTDPRFFPYRYGQALWAYIGGRWGDRTVTELYKAALQGGWPAAVHRYLGLTPDQLSREWLTTIRATYLPLMEGRERPGDIAQKVLASDIDAGEMNVSPAVSPDGRCLEHGVRRVELPELRGGVVAGREGVRVHGVLGRGQRAGDPGRGQPEGGATHPPEECGCGTESGVVAGRPAHRVLGHEGGHERPVRAGSGHEQAGAADG